MAATWTASATVTDLDAALITINATATDDGVAYEYSLPGVAGKHRTDPGWAAGIKQKLLAMHAEAKAKTSRSAVLKTAIDNKLAAVLS